MPQRPRKKIPPSPLDYYRDWCQRRIAKAEADNFPRLADDERKFLGLIESSEELKALCRGHPPEKLHPLVAALHQIHVLSFITPGPVERARRIKRRNAAHAAVSPLARYIATLKQFPDGEVSIDTLTLLENALYVTRHDYWDLSHAWPEPTQFGRAFAQPKEPPRRPPHRPRGSFDPFSRVIYLIAMEVRDLTGAHDWVIVKNLLAHFLPREFASFTNVDARSKAKTFARAYPEDQLGTFRKNHSQRSARYFDQPTPSQKS